MEEEALSKKSIDSALTRRLLRYVAPHWALVGVALAAMFATSGLQIVGPILTKLAVDRFLAPSKQIEPSLLDPWLAADPLTGITQISAMFLAGTLLGLAFSFVQSYMMQRTGQLAMFDLRRDLMAHLHRLDLAYYDRQPVGRLVTRVTTDVDALNEMFTSGLVALVGDIVIILFLIGAMVKMSVGMTLLLLSAMPLLVIATQVFKKAAQAGNRRIRLAVARINAFLQEHVTGMSVLQLFNREAKAKEQFDVANHEHLVAFKDVIQAYGWFYPVVEFVGMLAIAGLLSYGGWRIQRGELTLGVLVAFFQYGMRFFRPIQDLSEKYNILVTAMAAGERVFGLLDERAWIAAPGKAAAFEAGAVEFDHVWFAYRDKNWVLRDVSFRIEPGQTVAVVGHTGAGKTTITSLLLRFHDAQKGAIRIGGVDIRELAPRELRSHFGVVLQDPFLFSGDMNRNIRLGTSRISDEDVRWAKQQVNLPELTGTGFSTGQKQLISFARALAHRPEYLIMDEATSSVDTETETKIRDALEKLLTARTSMVIAHRLSTIQRADRILVMHKGELRESGTHQELLALRGIYWKLYRLQYQEQETEVRG